MSENPAPRPGRRLLVGLVWAGWAALVLATALGFTAAWIPAFDLINEARPITALLALALLAAALLLRDPPLIRPAVALALVHAGLLLLPWARAAAGASGQPPTLRLVTFDLGAGNERFDEIADFILGAGADIVLLQEVSCGAVDRLIPWLRQAYPSAFVSAENCSGQALLAKRAWSAVGQVIAGARQPLFVSARFQWGNSVFTLTGVRLADPFSPAALAADEERLRAHLATQGSAQIIAGALNVTPFAWTFAQLQNAGFGQHATYLATWPAQWPAPLFLMDNVLSTDRIASMRVASGPALGSDHRPLIADIVFVR